ncbi:DNA cytosine methyltransferase [Treponema sp. Marseille-Q3903]|uniref:DNA cytosine methyltransferase n=1 Tax=Treponema sp. Marseille-Q3903 TaxID=2766703 RepID=UPI0016522AD6|nr:DNA cytosine methyltransferase [Treponema sp. Marseille-Q3903]
MENVLNCIDLFCGCGGLSLGFEKAGINVLVGIDAWQDAITTFNYNHKNSKGICADLSTLEPSEIEKELNGKSVDLIIGGPPCQGFSVAGKRIVDDVRNKLYKNFVRFVEYYKPKAFMMENVPNILSIGGGIVRDSIVKDFSDLGYKVVYQVLTASNYGTPQNRKRAVFVGFKNGYEFKFPERTVEKLITSSEALSDLPENSLEDGTSYPVAPNCDYQKLMRCNSNKVYNHQITEHSERTKEIIALVPDGGNYKNLPQELQQTRKVHIAWTRLNSQKPSFTIDTGHRHHFHYKWNRIPTVRESARIQSFPDDFIFLGTKTSQYKQVGNAVPPLMAEAIAKTIK